MRFCYEEIDKICSDLELNRRLNEISKSCFEQCLQYATTTKEQLKSIENAVSSGLITIAVGEQRMLSMVTDLKIHVNEIIRTEKRHKKNRKKAKSVALFFAVIAGLGAIIGSVFLVKTIMHQNIVNDHLVTVQTLQQLPLPKQKTAFGKTKVEYDDEKAEITYLASYVLYGRVMSTYEHWGGSHGHYEALWPKDICVSYGELADYADRFGWSSGYNDNSGTRTCWIKYERGESPDDSLWSNNHLIPANDKVRELIMNIQVGDYVKLEGYLAEMKADDFYVVSSLSRDDEGKTEFGKKYGRCEIIYVTNVDWLTDK